MRNNKITYSYYIIIELFYINFFENVFIFSDVYVYVYMNNIIYPKNCLSTFISLILYY